ncbi:MAG: putative protein N(5)-glutamine methyltransferase [Actinomycetota bacterium]|nr:putative protein N(5)-glutamine methyltransferase [Actinomycetota bacterium]
MAGVPLEHVVGWVEFATVRVAVDPGVFIPRRRTEFLVEQAVASLPRQDGHRASTKAASSAGKRRPRTLSDEDSGGVLRLPVVLDLCCGTGAIGIALVTECDRRGWGRVELHAADVDPAAVRCARGNLASIGRVYESDLFDALPTRLRGRVEVLVANAPYVPTDSLELLPSEARLYEPRTALNGGIDGMDVLRRVAVEAPSWLSVGGRLLVEASERQAPKVRDVFARNGLIATLVRSAEFEASVVIGVSPQR